MSSPSASPVRESLVYEERVTINYWIKYYFREGILIESGNLDIQTQGHILQICEILDTGFTTVHELRNYHSNWLERQEHGRKYLLIYCGELHRIF